MVRNQPQGGEAAKPYQKACIPHNTSMQNEELHAEEVTGKQPTDKKLWSFIGSKTHTMKHKQFLWKITHDAYKVGQYWKNIPNHEEQEACGCGAGDGIKSMRYILMVCQYPGQKELW
jgi:hypothetical protein